MEPITNTDTLKQAIETLKWKRDQEALLVREHFSDVCESLKPSNLIKSSLGSIVDPDHKGDLGNSAIGVASGLLAKKLLFKSSSNPLKKLAGVAVQALVTKFAARHSDKIKDSGKNILLRLAEKLRRKKEAVPEM